VRTSYLPNEILWGYRFEHTCVAYDKESAKYAVSFSNLNKHVADRTPRYVRSVPEHFFPWFCDTVLAEFYNLIFYIGGKGGEGGGLVLVRMRR